MSKITPKAKRLRSLKHGRRASRSRSICIVTSLLYGLSTDEEASDATKSVALWLHELGYRVDVLYARAVQDDQIYSFAQLVKVSRPLGINLICVDNLDKNSDHSEKSYRTLQYLLRHRYEMVLFDDDGGIAYYPLLARRTGCAQLRGTTMCVTARGAAEWTMEIGSSRTISFETLRLMEMKRRSIELADSVKAQSAYILEKYRDYGWRVPDNCLVIPDFVSTHQQVDRQPKRASVREIVFFNRMAAGNGLLMFCRAIDRLKYRLQGRSVAFLGPASAQAIETLIRHAATWPFTVHILTDLDRKQAYAYVKAGERLAVIPTPEGANSGAIVECLEQNIPFIACSGGGHEELLDKDSRKANLFTPTVDGLCDKLLDKFEQHEISIARPAFDPMRLRSTFGQWVAHQFNLDHAPSAELTAAPIAEKPVLIVVVPSRFDPEVACAKLRQTIADYGGKLNIEVLAAEPRNLQGRLSSGEKPLVNVSAHGDFGAVAQSLASQELAIVGLCHVTQLIPPQWVDRARECFVARNGISALTGMTVAQAGMTARPTDPQASAEDSTRRPERYLLGNTLPLFALVRETNSGFLLLKSSVLAKCAGVGPLDEPYDLLKNMLDWVHEILVTLYISSERFELVPDQIMEQAVEYTGFEVFRLEQFMRSLATRLYGHVVGSEPYALARLAIDLGLERERSLEHARYIRGITERIGSEVQLLTLSAASDVQARQLAKIALANGQAGLAADLSSDLLAR